MSTASVTPSALYRKLKKLPPSSLSEVDHFIDFLQFKTQREGAPKRVVRLGGLWKDTPPITEEDIAEARREMWGSLGEEL